MSDAPTPTPAVAKPAFALTAKPVAAKPAFAKPALAVAKPSVTAAKPAAPVTQPVAITPTASAPTQVASTYPPNVQPAASKPGGIVIRKPSAPMMKKPGAPVSTGPLTAKPPGVVFKKVPASTPSLGAKPAAPAPPGSINTLRKRWEHTMTSSADGKVAMCEKKNLQPMLKLVRSNNVKVQSLASEVIENLEELVNGELYMEATNGFRPLVDLTKHNEEDIQIDALWSLALLAAHQPCQANIMNEVGWHNIRTRYVTSPLPEMQKATARLLANLSQEQNNQEGIISKGVPLLLELFQQTGDGSVKEEVTKALATICVINDYGGSDIWNTTLLDLVIPLVSDDERPKVQAGAVHILRNICAAASPDVLRKVIKANVLEALIHLLSTDDTELLGHDTMILAYLAKIEEGIKEIDLLGGYRSIIALLDSSDVRVQLGVTSAIDVMSLNATNGVQLVQGGVVEPLKELIFTTPSQEVEELAMRALAKLDSEAWKYVEKRLMEAPKRRAAAAAKPEPSHDDTRRVAEEQQRRAAEEAKRQEDEIKRRRDDEERRRRDEEERRRRDDDDRRKREEEERQRMFERLGKEEQVEKSRLQIMRQLEDERRKMDEERRKLEEERLKLDLLRRQMDEEAKIRADKEHLERELEKQKRNMELSKIEEDRRRMEERMEEQQQKIQSQKAELDRERHRLDELRKREHDGEKRILDDRLKGEREMIDMERKAMEEERRRLQKLQKEREEEDKLRSERLRIEHEIEMQKLHAERLRLEDEKRRSEELIREEKERVERLKMEMELERERRKRDDEERSKRDLEMQEMLRKDMGDKMADELRLLQERIRSERAALEDEMHKVSAWNAERKKLDEERESLEKLKLQMEVDRLQREKEDRERKDREREELDDLKRKIEEAREAANAEMRAFREREIEWTKRMDEERDKFVDDRQRLDKEKSDLERQLMERMEKQGDQERSEYDQKMMAEELRRVQEERDRLAHERQLFEQQRKAEEKELLGLLEKEEEARKAAEAERKQLQEIENNIKAERMTVEQQKQAIVSLLDASKSDDEHQAQAGNIGRAANDDLKAELEKEKARLRLAEEEAQQKLDAERAMLEEERRKFEEERLQISSLAQKEAELNDREKKIRASEEEIIKVMMKNRDVKGEEDHDISDSASMISNTDSSRSRSRTPSRYSSRSRSPRRGRSLSRTSSFSSYTRSYSYSRSRSRSRSNSRSSATYSSSRSRSRSRSNSRGRGKGRGRGRSPSLSEFTDDTYSEYSRTEGSDTEGAAVAKKPKTLSERDKNYVDTPDAFDGGENAASDTDSVSSIEGLASSDPHRAARSLVRNLAKDTSRKMNEPSMDTLRKFAKMRSGVPSQYEARDIIPVLVSILNVYTDTSHEEIIKTTLLILSILAYNKDSNQFYIRRANGGGIFIELLGFSLTSIKSRAALALAAYCLNNAPIKRECAPAIPKLVAMLPTADEPLKRSICACLAALADDNRGNQKRIYHTGGVKQLVQMVASNQIPPKYALHLICSLAHKNKTIQNEVRKVYPGVYRKVVRLLSPYTKPRILHAAISTLVELARNNAKNQKAIYEAGAVPYLVNILISPAPRSDDMIANCLYLCWAMGKHIKGGLNNPEFRNPKGTIREVMQPLRAVENEQIQKIIANMDSLLNNPVN